jgi:hypothetical protein
VVSTGIAIGNERAEVEFIRPSEHTGHTVRIGRTRKRGTRGWEWKELLFRDKRFTSWPKGWSDKLRAELEKLILSRT